MTLVNFALRETCSVVVALGSERGYCGTWKPQQPFVLRVSFFSRCGHLLLSEAYSSKKKGRTISCLCLGWRLRHEKLNFWSKKKYGMWDCPRDTVLTLWPGQDLLSVHFSVLIFKTVILKADRTPAEAF